MIRKLTRFVNLFRFVGCDVCEGTFNRNNIARLSIFRVGFGICHKCIVHSDYIPARKSSVRYVPSAIFRGEVRSDLFPSDPSSSGAVECRCDSCHCLIDQSAVGEDWFLDFFSVLCDVCKVARKSSAEAVPSLAFRWPSGLREHQFSVASSGASPSPTPSTTFDF